MVLARTSNHSTALLRGKLRWRQIVKLALLTVAALSATLLLVIAIRVAPLLFEPNRYQHVASIEATETYRDPASMQRAWALPVASAYRRAGFEFQKNPSYCGPASLANMLRSIGIRTNQNQVIGGTRFEPWSGILLGGLTLDELAELASQRLGRRVTKVRDVSLPEFRQWLRRSNVPSYRILVNFHRGPLFGRGHGHFSPILGYLEREDLALVGDVNSDYRPFLVSSERLWRGTDTVDRDTGKERGLIVARLG